MELIKAEMFAKTILQVLRKVEPVPIAQTSCCHKFLLFVTFSNHGRADLNPFVDDGVRSKDLLLALGSSTRLVCCALSCAYGGCFAFLVVVVNLRDGGKVFLLRFAFIDHDGCVLVIYPSENLSFIPKLI